MPINRTAAFLLSSFLALSSALARDVRVEFLVAKITPQAAALLSSLSCRDVDHVVHLRLSIQWPNDATSLETTDFKRLVFWNKETEFLFPYGSYNYQHGSYVVNGYFIPRSGGIHQGVLSDAFEKVDDTKVLLNPSVKEVRTKATTCPR